MASRNLTIGKGEAWFAQFKPGTQTPAGERFLGNCPEFTVAREVETLKHNSSTRGLKVQDDETTLGVTNTASLSCDDVQPANLALFFLGSSDTLTVVEAAGEAETITAVEPGLTYQVGTSATNPQGVRNISALTVTVVAVVMVEDTDYSVDLARGRITVIAGGDIVADDDLILDYTIDASTRSRIISGDDQIEGSMRFISYNPKGDPIDYFMPWVKIKPNGDISLIGEEYMTLPLTLTALVKGSLAAIYGDGVAV
jgi:hypothetical protein